MTTRPAQLALALFRDAPARFEDFVPGPNAEVLAMLRRWSAGSGPWFILLWGRDTTGKTHLARAAALAAEHGGKSVAYAPLRAWAAAGELEFERLERFAVLCIDDVDTIAGDPGAERRLFDLYNLAQSRGSRLLMTASKPPRSLALGLDDLTSRLSAGLVYQLTELPEADKRQALVRRAGERGIELPANVADYLLRRLPRDMGALMASLDALDEASLRADRPLTIPFARDVLALDRS